MLEFNIRNQEISRIDNFSPAEKSVDYLVAKFNFKTDDWNDAVKRAIFKNVKSKVEKDTVLEDDECKVPWEVLDRSGEIEVSVHGVIDTEEITTNVATCNLNRTLSGGSASQEPSPTTYKQMVGIVKSAEDIAQSVRTDADNGKFNGENGKDGEKGDNGKSAYEYAVEGGYQGTEAEFMESLARAGDVITKEEHEAELLKAMVKVTTEEAPYHHITDSANMKVVDFGMRGITEQPSTEGKNQFDIHSTDFLVGPTVQTATKNSDTVKITHLNGDSYQYENICNATILSLYYPITLKANTEYYISGKSTPSSYPISFPNEDDNNQLLDVPADGTLYSRRTGDNGEMYVKLSVTRLDGNLVSTYTNVAIMEKCYSDYTYEPYTNGASPNPTYEQPITLAGVYNEETGRYEHKCCVGNKNLVDLKVENITVVQGRLTNIENGIEFIYTNEITSACKFNEPLKPNTTYTISCNFEFNSDHPGLKYLPAVCVTTNVDWWLVSRAIAYILATSTKKSITFTTPDTDEDIWIYIVGTAMQNNVTGTTKFTNFMITMESSASDDYTPHASQPFTLTSDRPLTKWDKLVKREGVYGWSIWHGKTDDLAQLVVGSYIDSNTKILNLNIKLPGAELYYINSQIFTEAGKQSANGTILYMPKTYEGEDVIIRCAVDDTIETAKEHLHYKAIWKTSTEQAFIPLPAEEQTLLHNLETYYGVTNVWSEQGCPIHLTYAADQELHWNQKLLQIQQAII